MRRLPAPLAGACLGLLAAVAVVSADTGRQVRPSPRLTEYRHAVAALRAGRPAEAVQLVERLVAGETRQSGPVAELRAAIRARADWLLLAEIEAGVLLHLEAFRDRSLLPSRRQYHLLAAWDIVDDAPSILPPEFVRDCHLLVVWSLQDEYAVEDLAVQIGFALKRFPEDAGLRLAQGSLWELLPVVPGVGSLAFELNKATIELAVPAYLGSPRGPLRVEPGFIQEKCARLYSDILRRSPESAEGRVRLARVLTQSGHFEAALAALAPLNRVGIDPELRYLARLFEGRALLGLGRTDPAMIAFDQAAEIFPGCQTPRLAQSAALRAAGELARAREVMLRTLTGPDSVTCGEDPWWQYSVGQAWRIESLVDRLLGSVRS